MSLKYALSTVLATAILTISLSGILQPGLSFNLSLANGEHNSNSLTVEKGDITLDSSLACIGCSGGGSGPG